MSYSKDMRERTLKYVRDGGSQKEAIRIFGVDRKTIYNWLHRENLSPTPCRQRNRVIDKSQLILHVRAHPDALLRERALEFKVSTSGMWRALCALRISKKND